MKSEGEETISRKEESHWNVAGLFAFIIGGVGSMVDGRGIGLAIGGAILCLAVAVLQTGRTIQNVLQERTGDTDQP